MKHDEFRRLLNRELDGLTTPEEEAALMDHVSRTAGAAREQALMHRLHRAFREMPPPVPPAGLSSRVSERVLAGPRPMPRWNLLRNAAAVLLVFGTGALLGGYVVGDGRTVHGSGDPAAVHREVVLEGMMREWGLERPAAERILGIRERYDRARDEVREKTRSEIEQLDDLETAAILAIMDEESRELYRRGQGMSAEEMRRLLELHEGR